MCFLLNNSRATITRSILQIGPERSRFAKETGGFFFFCLVFNFSKGVTSRTTPLGSRYLRACTLSRKSWRFWDALTRFKFYTMFLWRANVTQHFYRYWYFFEFPANTKYCTKRRMADGVRATVQSLKWKPTFYAISRCNNGKCVL